MPYHMEWQPQGVYKRFVGLVTADELMGAIAEFQGSRQFEQMRYAINDFSAVEGHTVTMQDVMRFAAHGIGASYTNANVRVALVVQNQALAPLIEAYRKAVANRYEVQVFERVAAAMAWAQAPLAP